MYLDMLASNSREFVTAVDRTFPRFRTKSLDAVVTALAQCQGQPNAMNLRDLLDKLVAWRGAEPMEYYNRGGTRGVAYRLWMETKQLVRNLGGYVAYPNDPPMPVGCPGDTILGTYVPEGEGHVEICHGFTYRWAIARGRIQETLPAGRNRTAFNGANMRPILFPLGVAGYPAARAGGVLQVQAGDILGMFNGNELGHSLVAVTPTTWFAANNAGSFGMGTGRSQVNIAGALPLNAGWQGNGNQWRRPDHVVLDVVCRR